VSEKPNIPLRPRAWVMGSRWSAVIESPCKRTGTVTALHSAPETLPPTRRGCDSAAPLAWPNSRRRPPYGGQISDHRD